MNELLRDEEMNQLESVVVAKMGDLDSLCDAFRGCHAVFHTSSFIDIHGVSGYSVSLLNYSITQLFNIDTHLEISRKLTVSVLISIVVEPPSSAPLVDTPMTAAGSIRHELASN